MIVIVENKNPNSGNDIIDLACFEYKLKRILFCKQFLLLFLSIVIILSSFIVNNFLISLKYKLINSIINSFIIFIILLCLYPFENDRNIRQNIFACITYIICSMYLIISSFLIFQNIKYIKFVLHYLDPSLKNHYTDSKDYATDCRFTLNAILPLIDFYCLAHLIGWTLKTMVIRDIKFLLYLSVMWELTEVCFSRVLPEFKECWWDSYLMDVVIFNGIGIIIGKYMCNIFNLKNRKWIDYTSTSNVSLKEYKNLSNYEYENLDKSLDSQRKISIKYVRIFELLYFSCIFILIELNPFFIKETYVPYFLHWFSIINVIITLPLTMYSTKQYYKFMKNPKIKSIGVFNILMIMKILSEMLLIYSHNYELFLRFSINRILLWILIQFVGLYIIVSVSEIWFMKKTPYKKLISKLND